MKFEKPDRTRNPKFGLMDTILEQYPDLLGIVKEDITQGTKKSKFGRGDVPSLEQIMRAAIYQDQRPGFPRFRISSNRFKNLFFILKN